MAQSDLIQHIQNDALAIGKTLLEETIKKCEQNEKNTRQTSSKNTESTISATKIQIQKNQANTASNRRLQKKQIINAIKHKKLKELFDQTLEKLSNLPDTTRQKLLKNWLSNLGQGHISTCIEWGENTKAALQSGQTLEKTDLKIKGGFLFENKTTQVDASLHTILTHFWPQIESKVAKQLF